MNDAVTLEEIAPIAENPIRLQKSIAHGAFVRHRITMYFSPASRASSWIVSTSFVPTPTRWKSGCTASVSINATPGASSRHAA